MTTIERKKGKNIITCSNGGTWNFRNWKNKRIYFSNDHWAVGSAKISFFWNLETRKFNKNFPVLKTEQDDIKAAIENGEI